MCNMLFTWFIRFKTYVCEGVSRLSYHSIERHAHKNKPFLFRSGIQTFRFILMGVFIHSLHCLAFPECTLERWVRSSYSTTVSHTTGKHLTGTLHSAPSFSGSSYLTWYFHSCGLERDMSPILLLVHWYWI